jgi:hypothetical protein
MVVVMDPHGHILDFLGQYRYCFFHLAPQFNHEAEWTLFQTHYCSENLVAFGIESGTSGSVAKNSDH